MEQMMMLRLPEGLEDRFKEGMEIVPAGDNLRVIFAADHSSFPAKLMPLSTAVEVHRRHQDDAILKRADVGQVLHVFLSEEEMMQNKMGGLTAPMHHRRIRSLTKEQNAAPFTAKIVQDIMRGWRQEVVEYAIVDSQPWMKDGDVLTLSQSLEHLILKHPETFFSLPFRQEEEGRDSDWMVDSSDED